MPVGTGGEKRGEGDRRQAQEAWDGGGETSGPPVKEARKQLIRICPSLFCLSLEAPLALSCPSLVTMATHSPNRTFGVLSPAPGAIRADRALIGLQKRGAGHVIMGEEGGAGTL